MRIRAAAGRDVKLRLPRHLDRLRRCPPRRACGDRRPRLVVRLHARSGCDGPLTAALWRCAAWRPYSSSSPFNRPIPSNPPLAANSERVVRQLTGWGPPQNLVAGGDHGWPVYFAAEDDPLHTVRCVEDWGRCEIEGHRIRIPRQARPAAPAHGDAHMAVVQPDGWEYDFWAVKRKDARAGTVTIGWGGRTRIDGDGLDSNATAGLFGLAAGTIRAAELEAGEIRHALFVSVRCDNGTSVYPTVGHSGLSCREAGVHAPDAPPMGARLQLAMTERQISRLPVRRWQKTILRALSRYGVIVGDTGNRHWILVTEAKEMYTSFGLQPPLLQFAQHHGWERYFDAELGRTVWVGRLAGAVDWRRHLRVVHPCVSAGSC